LFPGKKLLFMGGELAQPGEWGFRGQLPWHLLDDPAHAGVRRMLADLNRLYVQDARLHAREFEPGGFRWIDCEDRQHSTLSWLRMAGGDPREALLVAANFTPMPRHGVRLGVPHAGAWREIFNTDSGHYGGANLGNLSLVHAQPVPAMGFEASVELTIPPLGAVVLAPVA
jgi:1,4-alpha-glucan branching enzyme